MPLFFRRLAEYFLPEVALSLIFSMLYRMEILVQTARACFIIMLFCHVIIVIHQSKCLSGYYYYTKNKRVYYRVNLTVFAIFAFFNIIMAVLNIEPLYTMLFFPYKIVSMMGANKMLSAGIVNAFMLGVIIFTPLTVPSAE